MTNVVPSGGATLSAPDRSLSLYISPQVLERIYSLFLWDLDTQSVPSASGMDVSGNKQTAEYFFTVPPQIHEMDENFATTVVPTQGGSKFTESYGSIIKNLRLSGTTGVRPHKVQRIAQQASDAFRDDLLNTTSPNQRQGAVGISASEVTGHDSVLTLRNLFRFYSDCQQNGKTNIVMVWRNVKDDDYWIVEPVKFKLNQTSKSPFSYTYNIDIKTLARFDRSLASISTEDSQDGIRGDLGFSARMQANSQTLVTSFYSAMAAGDILGSAVNVSVITNPMQQMVGMITKISTSNGIVPAESIIDTAFRLKQACVSSISSIINLPSATSKRSRRLVRDLRRLRITCDSILCEKRFRNATKAYFAKRDRITKAYNAPNPFAPGSTSLPNTNGSITFLANTPSSSNTSSGVVNTADDIRMIAQRYLGDPRRWQELVVLNGLKPPYISPTGAGNTLKPGDAILFPSVSSPNAQTLIGTQNGSNQNYDDDNLRDNTLLLDQTYGRDILLSSNESAGSFDLTDLSVNQRGDLATISGIPNVKQAINIKFATEVGELKMHPFFGARYAIGSKATVNSFNEFRVNTLATFLSDGRIEQLESLALQTIEDTLFVSAVAKLTNGEDYINTSFALRRF